MESCGEREHAASSALICVPPPKARQLRFSNPPVPAVLKAESGVRSPLCGEPRTSVLDQSCPEAVRALRKLEEQCGGGNALVDVVRLLRSIAEYGGRARGAARAISMRSQGYEDKVGKYEAGRELLALIGFCHMREGDEEHLYMKASDTVDPAVVCALNAALLRLSGEKPTLAPGSSSSSVVAQAPPQTHDAGRVAKLCPAALSEEACDEGLESRPSFLSPTADATKQVRRNPLSNRLPALPPNLLNDVLLQDTQLITQALQDGGSALCPFCSGVVLVERFPQHQEHWCPAIGGHSSEEFSEE
eukprot:Rhum_TRINITY_DN14879_c2_g1::Rhum_TRINITY_DN14879_c2_g1_i4::g.124128::m.124128